VATRFPNSEFGIPNLDPARLRRTMGDQTAQPCWIDSHAHLTMFEPGEVDEVLGRAVDRGVSGVLVPATGPGDLERTVRLIERRPDRVVGAVGVHPHEASALDAVLKLEVESLLGRAGVVAVGEIGLDYHYMNSPREDQLTALAWMLDLAIGADVPVVLHNRDSWHDLEPMLAARRGKLQGICHSFTEGPDEARRVVELGLSVGISGMVTFNRADNIRRMVSSLKPNEMMVETDSPYLAPMPHRGRRNEPEFVVFTGERVADVVGLDPLALADVTTENFRRLFRVADDWATAQHGYSPAG
jgi:TatD DNase family protein